MSKVEQEVPGAPETRNSWFRKFSVVPKTLAKGILWVDPNADPNDYTRRSLTSAIDASIDSAKLNADGKVHFRDSLPPLKSFVKSIFFDWLDGALAARKNEINPGSHDTREGGRLDACYDKLCRLAGGTSRMVTAYRRGDRYGEIVAGAATVTAPLSAYYRADGESRGEKFNESGNGIKKKDILGFLGTQLGGNLLTISETLWGNASMSIKGRTIYCQDIADTISFISNVKTAWARSQGGKPIELPSPNDPKYGEAVTDLNKIKDDAKYRKKGLRWVFIGGGLAIGATGILLHLQDNNKK